MILRATLVILLSAAAVTQADAPRENDDFLKGNFSLQLYAAYAPEFFPDDHEKLTIGTVAAGYFLFDHFSVNLELPFYYIDQPADENAVAMGGNLLLRKHMLVRESLSIYA